MNKAYIAGALGAIIIGSIWLSQAIGAPIPYVHRAEDKADNACKAALLNGIKSVYAEVLPTTVNRWYCSHVTEEEQDAELVPVDKWRCGGGFDPIQSDETWYNRAKATGNLADDATLPLTEVELDTQQKQAHAGILSACLGGVPAQDLVDFDARKSLFGKIIIIDLTWNYKASAASATELRQLNREKKVVKLL